jgi:hypothetical protein
MNAQLVTSATGKYTTTCRLCRKEVAKAPALDIPVVGQPGKRLNELIAVLIKHLLKHHGQDLERGARIVDEVRAFLVLTAYDHEDPVAPKMIEDIRAQLFQRVRKNTMEDAMIEHVVAGFGLDPDDADKVNQAMKSLRDACCELGTFAPPA